MGRPQGVLSLKHINGLALPVWLTPHYIISSNGLIERADIGRVYPERLQSLLLGATSDAQKREQLFADQISAYLPLQALELSLKKENGLTPRGARYVAALMQSNTVDRQVDGAPVVIRHLAMVRRSGAAPDVVNNMFIIEQADASVGPHLLYRPFYPQSLHEFPTRAALLEAIARPGELQTSVLVWLNSLARTIYDNGGFQEPHYVRFGLGSDFAPIEVPPPAALSDDGASDELFQYLHNGKLLHFLYMSNASALVSQAERDSVSNTESRWGVLLERTNQIFNLVLLPFLSVPTLLTVGLSVMLLAAIKDIPALSSEDPITRELGLVDLLLNLTMVLFPPSASVPARPALAEGVREQVVKSRVPVRSAERWPALASPYVSAGVVAFAGELPDVQSTPLDFSFASSQHRLTPSQRKMLSHFEVMKPAPMPQPILRNPSADVPRKGLYVINDNWHALVEEALYEVSVGSEGVVIIDPTDRRHLGPYLKSSGNGRWSLDLRLRLSGGMPGEPQALIHQALADAHAARAGVDVEHTQLGGAGVMAHHEHRSHHLAVLFRDPAALAAGIKFAQVLGDDFRHQRFELPIPVVFTRIQGGLSLYHQAHVTGLRIAQQVARRRALQQGLDTLHGGGQLLLLWLGQGFQQGDHFVLGALLQRRQHRAAEIAEVQLYGAGVGDGADFLDQALLLEPADQSAQVARIQAEHLAQVGAGQVATGRQLVHHADFGE